MLKSPKTKPPPSGVPESGDPVMSAKRNISVSTHAPAGARRIHTCLTYLRKRLLNVIPRYDAESSVVKFRNVSESEAAGPRVHRRKRRRC